MDNLKNAISYLQEHDSEIVEESKPGKQKILAYIGDDSWGRPVYEDENKKLWKDTDNRRGWLGRLYSSYKNEFEGEPDCPMREDIKCIFIPERIVRD